MFYDRYLELCKEKGVKPTNACVDAGLSRGLAAKWKSTQTEKPSADALEKLAHYFEMSIDEILGNTKAPSQKEGRGSDPDIRRIERARKKMSAQDKENMMTLLEISFSDYFSDDYEDEDIDE